jgi:AcrR family transcriptional regulator
LDKAQSRVRMLAAARKLFQRHGYEAVSMRQIAKASKCTPGALYIHFADKHQLVVAMMDEDFALLSAGIKTCASIANPVLRLREVGRSYVRFALEHPHHYRMMFMTPKPTIDVSEYSEIKHGNPDKDGYAFMRATVAQCIEQGKFLPRYNDVEMVTQSCWASAHGFVSLYINYGEDPWVEFGEPLAGAYACLDMHMDGLTGGAFSREHADTSAKGGNP